MCDQVSSGIQIKPVYLAIVDISVYLGLMNPDLFD